MKVIVDNRKARFDYHFEEVYEAGLVLTGSEVKSLRQGRANLQDAYAVLKGGEAFLLGSHIAAYDKGGIVNHDPYRTRKLLLHKKEIAEMGGRVHQKGMTIVPVKLYFDDHGLAKIQVALARGQKSYDKRHAMAERDAKRAIDRAMKSSRR